MSERRATLPPPPQEHARLPEYPPAEVLDFSIFGKHAETMKQMYGILMEWMLTPLIVDRFATAKERDAYEKSLSDKERERFYEERHRNKLSGNAIIATLQTLSIIDRCSGEFPTPIKEAMHDILYLNNHGYDASFVSSAISTLTKLNKIEHVLEGAIHIGAEIPPVGASELRAWRVELVQRLDKVVDDLVARILRYTYPAVAKEDEVL